MSNALDAATLAVKLVQSYGVRGDNYNAGFIAADTIKLMRLAASLHALEIKEYNRSVGQEESQKDSKRDTRLRKEITTTLRLYGLTWTPSKDVRGHAVHIHFPDGSYNTLGGRESGWGL